MTPDFPPAVASALKRHWGADAFRPGQQEAIGAVLGGRDVLAVLPTGGGKSVLYQLPAVVLDGVVLVVSPLIALMEDQVRGLTARKIPAVALHAGRPPRAVEQALTDAEFGKYRLVYLTPERLLADGFLARLERLPVSLLAVDEAHCISEWGHDFRPAYRRLAEARAHLEGTGRAFPVLAVTATATPEVRRDVLDQLALRDPEVVVRGFDRPNLVWSVHRDEDKVAKVVEIARAVPGSGVVYAGTRHGSETWAKALARAGVPCEAYHGGMGPEARSAVQARWMDGRVRFLAATSAFGMGVDKPDVRVVVHVALPPTLEAYYQEAGRAGRDGRRAYAVLLAHDGDEELPRSLAREGHPDAPTLQRVYAAAGSLAGLAIGAEADGPTPLDVDTLARTAAVTPLAARAALDRLAEAGLWSVRRPKDGACLLRVDDAEALRRWAETAAEAPARFARALLRLLPPAAYGAWAEVALEPIAQRMKLAPERVGAGLAFLAQRALLEVRGAGAAVYLDWQGPRVERLALDVRALEAGRQRAERRLDHVLAYARGVGCRRRHLLAYFGEASPARCGRCDVCLGRHRPPVVTPADEPLLREILHHVERGEPRAAWLHESALPAHRRDALADWLLHEGLLQLADPLADRYELAPKGLRALRQG